MTVSAPGTATQSDLVALPTVADVFGATAARLASTTALRTLNGAEAASPPDRREVRRPDRGALREMSGCAPTVPNRMVQGGEALPTRPS